MAVLTTSMSVLLNRLKINFYPSGSCTQTHALVDTALWLSRMANPSLGATNIGCLTTSLAILNLNPTQTAYHLLVKHHRGATTLLSPTGLQASTHMVMRALRGRKPAEVSIMRYVARGILDSHVILIGQLYFSLCPCSVKSFKAMHISSGGF